MKKVLYISDLDGTLLQKDMRISQESCKIINKLISQGMQFSFATARSVHTAMVVAQGLELRLPIIVNNGTFILNPNETCMDKKIIMSNKFSKEKSENIYKILQKYEIEPLVYAMINGTERFSYYQKKINHAMMDFVNTRKDDGRDRPLNKGDNILEGEVFYFSCIGEEEKLTLAYSELKENYNCIYQKDIYSNEQWLEILPKAATKANAALQMKKIYGCDEVVVFGDGINDIPMFMIADRSYAVANAVPELKELATQIIGKNDEDGVAKWLLDNVGKE